MPKFFEYDIHYWQDNIRFMNVVGNREGGGNSVCPLLFDGATNTFLTLPLPNQDLSKYKTLVNRIRNDIYVLPVTQVMAVIKPIYKNYKKLKKNVKNSNTWKNWKRKIHFHW